MERELSATHACSTGLTLHCLRSRQCSHYSNPDPATLSRTPVPNPSSTTDEPTSSGNSVSFCDDIYNLLITSTTPLSLSLLFSINIFLLTRKNCTQLYMCTHTQWVIEMTPYLVEPITKLLPTNFHYFCERIMHPYAYIQRLLINCKVSVGTSTAAGPSEDEEDKIIVRICDSDMIHQWPWDASGLKTTPETH